MFGNVLSRPHSPPPPPPGVLRAPTSPWTWSPWLVQSPCTRPCSAAKTAGLLPPGHSHNKASISNQFSSSLGLGSNPSVTPTLSSAFSLPGVLVLWSLTNLFWPFSSEEYWHLLEQMLLARNKPMIKVDLDMMAFHGGQQELLWPRCVVCSKEQSVQAYLSWDRWADQLLLNLGSHASPTPTWHFFETPAILLSASLCSSSLSSASLSLIY